MRIQSVKQSPNFEALKYKKPDLRHVTEARKDYFLRGQRGGKKPSRPRQLGAMLLGVFTKRLSS